MGFFVAGELLAQRANSSWEQVLSGSFFAPLNMGRTGFAANLDGANVAVPHARLDGQIRTLPWDRSGGFGAAGAVTSTASDMAKWMLMHLNRGAYQGKQILKSETVDAIFSPAMVGEVSFSEAPPINTNSSFSYGLGWNTYNYKGQMIVEKGGGLDGIRTVVTLIPELKLGICVLTNLNLTLLPEAIRAKFLEQYLGKNETDVQAEIKSKQAELFNLLKKEERPKDALPLGHQLEQYTGLFESQLYGLFKLVIENKQLIIEAGPARWKGTLTPWSNDTFILEWPTVNSGNQRVTFMFGPNNQAIELQTETLGIFKRKT